MAPDEFKKLYMCEFEPSEEDIRLHEIAKKYHEEAEAYDKSVCRFVNDRGVTIPASSSEMRLVNLNATNLRSTLIQQNSDLDPRHIRQAIKNYRE